MHKATARFWRLLNRLPENLREKAKRNFDLLRKTLLFISRKLAIFGQLELGLIIEPLQSKTDKISFGFELVPILNMNEWSERWINKSLQWTRNPPAPSAWRLLATEIKRQLSSLWRDLAHKRPAAGADQAEESAGQPTAGHAANCRL